MATDEEEEITLDGLTDELILGIFAHLDAPSLLVCSCVCKRWLQIAYTQSLWKHLVLTRWPSQCWLYQNTPSSALNWWLTYREFTQYSWYTADEMKYFTFCTNVENEPIAVTLRDAVGEKIKVVQSKWTSFDAQVDHQGDMVERYFNQNMELMFNTNTLNWVFLDKRRGYMEELFKKKNISKSKFYVRPYQVIPSCLVMYRWLCMFPSFAADEPGLTFYRVWRFRLKHIETGLVFELCDWKAAMSSTLSKGKPSVTSFLNDALELLQLITHPHFVMHPLGLHPRIQRTFYYEIRASAGGYMHRSRRPMTKGRHKRKTQSPTPSVLEENAKKDYFPDIDERLEKWRARRRMALLAPLTYNCSLTVHDASSHLSSSHVTNSYVTNSYSSYVTSDTEMDFSTEDRTDTENVLSDAEDPDDYEHGFVTNCAYYISSASCFDNVEEQHSLQASIADNWIHTDEECDEKIAVLYDLSDESWYFQSEKPVYDPNNVCMHDENDAKKDEENEDIIGNAVKKLLLHIPKERLIPTPKEISPTFYFDYYSKNLESIPSALALYRLICMFEITTSMYLSDQPNSVWNLSMVHKRTGGVVNFMDYNGMFQVYVSMLGIKVTEHMREEDPEWSDTVIMSNLLSEFRTSVTQLLDLLLSEDFCHPYGTIAGAVA